LRQSLPILEIIPSFSHRKRVDLEISNISQISMVLYPFLREAFLALFLKLNLSMKESIADFQKNVLDKIQLFLSSNIILMVRKLTYLSILGIFFMSSTLSERQEMTVDGGNPERGENGNYSQESEVIESLKEFLIQKPPGPFGEAAGREASFSSGAFLSMRPRTDLNPSPR